MPRVFKDLIFSRAAAKVKISDEALRRAAKEADEGLVDAYLGGELVKKRIPRAGGGKRDGYRMVLAFRKGDRSFFIHMFAKNDQSNISDEDLADLKIYAKILLGLDNRGLTTALDAGKLLEIADE